MNIPIFRLLNTNKAVTDLLGVDDDLRVWRNCAPEQPTYPYVVFVVVGGEPLNHVDEPALDDNLQIQIDIYAKSENQRDDVFRVVRNVLKHHCYIDGFLPIGASPSQAGSFRESFTTSWLIEA